MTKKIGIIGAGFSGLSAAAYAAKAGHEVHVYEKHIQPGGRARQFTTPDGYAFDMGPSWYWMPDVIDRFFNDFGYRTEDFYKLVRLDPQFEMVFSDSTMQIPADYPALRVLFEQTETGAGARLDAFMASAEQKYKVSMQDLVYKPCHSWAEFIHPSVMRNAFRLDLLTNFRKYVRRYFTDPRLIALMEFPVIFLGASPQQIPAMYSLMNYGGYVLGTWYPMGGFYQLVKAMQQVATSVGVQFHFQQHIDNIRHTQKRVTGLTANGTTHAYDAVIASSDYHHTESLLTPDTRNYPQEYWSKKTFAPSCLIFYVGLNRKIERLQHHTLFFEHDLDRHIDSIYQSPAWPEAPLFYVCCPSRTDPDVAPEGHENLFILMPIATGLEDDHSIREDYFQRMLRRIERHTGVADIAGYIDYKSSYCVRDFIQDYHAYGGNAYGLANTWNQTAVWKPSIRNRHLQNLVYTGQLTVPGPGVPPAIISGKIAATDLLASGIS